MSIFSSTKRYNTVVIVIFVTVFRYYFIKLNFFFQLIFSVLCEKLLQTEQLPNLSNDIVS